MKKIFKRLSVLLLVACMFFQWQPLAIALEPGVPDMATDYQPLLVRLQMTGIPLRLPTYVPATAAIRNADPQETAATRKLPVYAHLDTDTPNGYAITLGYTETCDGGNTCRLGSLVADRITNGTPPIDEQYGFMKPNAGFKGVRSAEVMTSVDLSQGIKGQFIPWICGASCNDAKVVWNEGGYRYSVGIKVGDKAELVAMANSAIASVTGAKP
jgi:hypothetical protein